LEIVSKTKIILCHDGERFDHAKIVSTAIGSILIGDQRYSQRYIATSSFYFEDYIPLKDLINKTENRAIEQVKEKLGIIKEILDLARQEGYEVEVQKDC